MMADLVGDCYWFPPAHRHVLICEIIALQAKSVIAHLQQIYGHDIANYEKDIVDWSMMDTATINSGELIIRLLRPSDVEAIKEMGKDVSLVVSPIVIPQPNATNGLCFFWRPSMGYENRHIVPRIA